MRLFIATLTVAFICMACSSSEPENSNSQHQYKNLTELSPPDGQEFDQSNVYIESVKMIDRDDKKALLINGNLASGCTKLQKASHKMQNDSLSLILTAWKPVDKMCTQALVPFSYIYEDLPQEQVKAVSGVTVNGKMYKTKP